jgi:hypothetical protein
MKRLVYEWFCPSIDVCAFCGDSECDGIACVAGLDPNNASDQEEIEKLQNMLRAGLLFIQANDALAIAENRKSRER